MQFILTLMTILAPYFNSFRTINACGGSLALKYSPIGGFNSGPRASLVMAFGSAPASNKRSINSALFGA